MLQREELAQAFLLNGFDPDQSFLLSYSFNRYSFTSQFITGGAEEFPLQLL